MTRFDRLYARAAERKDGEAALEALLIHPKSADELRQISDDRYLSVMTRRVFRAGLKHSMVDAKWPAFEARFFNFLPEKLLLLTDEHMESMMQDARLIRHWGKLKAVRANAQWVQDVAREHGSFGDFLAAWPREDTVGLWRQMARRGSHLGGMSGPYFLRMVGRDTFVFTRDVVAALRSLGVIDKDKAPTSQKDLAQVQQHFNAWADESGRPLCQISQVLAFNVNG